MESLFYVGLHPKIEIQRAIQEKESELARRHDRCKDNLTTVLRKSVQAIHKEYVDQKGSLTADGQLSHFVSRDLADILYHTIEAIFLHGLISMDGSNPDKCSFWRMLVNSDAKKHFLSRVMSIPLIVTNVGRCRAWIRLILSEQVMDCNLKVIQDDTHLIKRHYEVWAYLRDVERNYILMSSIEGLEKMKFEFNGNSNVLNEWSATALVLAGLTAATSSLPGSLKLLTTGLRRTSDMKQISLRNSASSEIKSPQIVEKLCSTLDFINSSDFSLQSTVHLRDERSRSSAVSDGLPKVDSSTQTEGSSFQFNESSHGSSLTQTRCVTFKLTEGLENDRGFYEIYYKQDPHTHKLFVVDIVKVDNLESKVMIEMGNLLRDRETKDNQCTACDVSIKCRGADQADSLVTDHMYSDEELVNKKPPTMNGCDAFTETEFIFLAFSEPSIYRRCVICCYCACECPPICELVYRQNDGDSGIGFVYKIVLSLDIKTILPTVVKFSKESFRRPKSHRYSTSECLFGSSIAQQGTKRMMRHVDSTQSLPPENSMYDTAEKLCDDTFISFEEMLEDYTKALPSTEKMSSMEDIAKLIDSLDQHSMSQEESQLEASYEKDDNENVSAVSCGDKDTDSDSEDEHQSNRLTEEERPFKKYIRMRADSKSTYSDDKFCAGCGVEIESIKHPTRFCHFDGVYYCQSCHKDKKFYIPAYMVVDWDFTKESVSERCRDFLMKTKDKPIINVAKINLNLYKERQEMQTVKTLRERLYSLYDYMRTCTTKMAKRYFEELDEHVRTKYRSKRIDMYSLQDLLDVKSGKLTQKLQKLVDKTTGHIMSCYQCLAKGFHCEICYMSASHHKLNGGESAEPFGHKENDSEDKAKAENERDKFPELIFPFDLENTHRCKACGNTYHKTCWEKESSCRRCIRIAAYKLESTPSENCTDEEEEPAIDLPVIVRMQASSEHGCSQSL